MVTLADVKNNPEVQELVVGAQKQLEKTIQKCKS